MKKILWLAVSSLMVLALLMTACGPAEIIATPTAPRTSAAPIATATSPVTSSSPVASSTPQPSQQAATPPETQKPQYGGILTMTGGDITNWDPNRLITGTVLNLTSEQLWEGDWALGPAGGYGANKTDWGFANNDLFDLKMGYLIDGWKWTVDNNTNTGTIIYTVRKGVHWALNQASEASRLVNGREMTTDDVFFSLKRSVTGSYSDGYIYITNIELRTANITKTGPQEITIQVPLAAMITAISRFGDSIFVVPPEVITKYGDMQKWQNNVGTGPFMVSEYVAGSSTTLIRNNNYWMKNPVGPGKGDQLPYLDKVKLLNIPDASTSQAAMRTAKLDWKGATLEQAAELDKIPALKKVTSTSFQGRGTPAFMRIDKAPYSDIRVRQALMMATDFQTILKDYRQGQGQIVTFPFSKVRGYEELYVSLDDPDFPAAAKDLYVYNPDKAKQLLKDAGYPNGFKTSIILSGSSTADIDYYSIVKGMWAKVGIDLTLDLKDSVSIGNIQRARSQDQLITNTTGPVAIFYVGNPIQGTGMYNLSMIDDPVINNAMIEVRLAAITDLHQSMKIFREKIFKYSLVQAYAIPNVIGLTQDYWWPWLKNYSGEISIGYDESQWPQFIWYDQALKTSMGY